MLHETAVRGLLLLLLFAGKMKSIDAIRFSIFSPTQMLILQCCAGFAGALSQSPVYYGYLGYSEFPSLDQQLELANSSLSFRFKFCQSDGILLYATDSQRIRYFSVGVSRSKILIEFDMGEDIKEVTHN